MPTDEKTIQLILTQTECNELANLIDGAIRWGGTMSARIGLKFIQRIEQELQTAVVTLPEPEKPKA